MKTRLIAMHCENVQDCIYNKLNDFSKSHPILGRLSSIPVSLLDVTVGTLQSPLSAIECIAMAAINLIGAAFSRIGAAFSRKYTLKDALANVEVSLANLANTAVKLLMTPFKIIFQTSAIIINPQTVQSINYNKPTFEHKTRSKLLY